MKKSLLSALLALAVASLSACADKSDAPSHADLLGVAGKILQECDQEVLGRKHQEGERITHDQSEALTKCMDRKGGDYKEKAEAAAAAAAAAAAKK